MYRRCLLLTLAMLVTVPASATQFIVRFADSASAAAARQSDEPTTRHKRAIDAGQPRHIATLATGADVFDIEDGNPAHFARLPGIVSVEEDRIIRPAALPDPLYSRQWSLHDPKAGIDAEVAWKYTRGEGAVIAVLDTGSTPHPDLDGQLLPGYDFISDEARARDGDGRDADPTDEGDWEDPGDCGRRIGARSSWHGTHVMALAGARRGNRLGIVGVAPEAKIIPVRVLGHCGGRLSDMIDALSWASGGEVRGVPALLRRPDVINLSLSTAGACGEALADALAQARARGVAVVVAAGNEGVAAAAFAPANCPGVITVAGLDRHASLAWYSNHGDSVTLAAPGGSLSGLRTDDLISAIDQGSRTHWRGVFGYMAGTSMAAPLVSGVVALMRSADPALDVAALTRHLVDNARPARCPHTCGAGMLDAGATLDAVAEERARR
ncbi:S8 family serine peptidase [Luteibacter aegosomatissinici]|uniref:S8 family serine peptidase n=1 Tax=Luteibacter aegosomatissinici TaxID=2911539 RepID=UPI001FF7981A|nr:S8 family serine peptidase [Luteibacter aegosomatissinici]UPG95633.1 S8 family serine peptidase [Luteibacter aegosomatissinici]